MRELIRPFLKWAGGKRQLLPEINACLPRNFYAMRYYEPFVGAGALFFDRRPRAAVINDYNAELILAYTVIKEDVDGLIEALTEHGARHCAEYYYRIRGLDRDRAAYEALADVWKAARLIYLNKTCYNGLYRVNSKGFFNVPYGRYANPAICEAPVLRAISGYLRDGGADIKIMRGDFADAVEGSGTDCFIYFDPPYHSPDDTAFTGYSAGKFNRDEQTRLRDVFSTRTDAGAKCLLSNSDTPFIRGLYDDKRFEIIAVNARRAINSNASARGAVNEVLIKNWK